MGKHSLCFVSHIMGPHLTLDFNPAAMGSFLLGHGPQACAHSLPLELADSLKLQKPTQSSEGQGW